MERTQLLGDALDRSDLARMQKFHAFGLVAPLLAIATSLALGGDPFARQLFWAGAALLGAMNAVNLWCARDPKRWYSPWRDLTWPISGIGLVPLLYYFGPFSAAAIVFVLGVVFVALGANKLLANGILAFVIVAHLALAFPILAGWIDDVGILSSAGRAPEQLAIAEGLILGLFASSFALGRWARGAAASALSELSDARRVIGEQQQALAEVHEDVEKVRLVNTGRWTGQTLGGWKLGLVLGRGAMGEVYEAAGADGTAAAVKLLTANMDTNQQAVSRFHREIDILLQMKSPHVVRVLDVSSPNAEIPYLAMERLRGHDLATLLRTRIRLPLLEMLAMLDQIARGLEVARLAGIVHRDLKPHNLFWHDNATWKILDFGIARIAETSGTLTGGGMVGTPQYMAPEQATGQAEVTHAADVYALGAIAYRCLTGRAPYTRQDTVGLVYQLVHERPVQPSKLARVAPGIEDILAIAMAKDPTKRFPTAIEFVRHLLSARDGRASQLEIPHDSWS